MGPRPKREDYGGNWNNYHDALFWWADEAEAEITALRAEALDRCANDLAAWKRAVCHLARRLGVSDELDPDLTKRCVEEIAALRAKLERATDLVRYARAYLHDEGVIDNAEYAALLADNEDGQRVARLAGYDDIRAKLEAWERSAQEGHPDPCTLGPLCPYCEIDRLRAELAAAKQDRRVAEDNEARHEKDLLAMMGERNLIQGELDALRAKLETAEKIAYRRGLEEGIRMYAWWVDGHQYVGTCGRTLEEALADLDAKKENSAP